MGKKFRALSAIAMMAFVPLCINARQKYNFNSDWSVKVFTCSEDAEKDSLSNTEEWATVTLPRAFNENEAFRVAIDSLSEARAWYVKEFKVPRKMRNGKVLVEFEGVRQSGEFYINGHRLGLHENGVMAVGYDLTPYIKWDEVNELRVRTDNDWDYEEKATGTKYQWNNKNFNANYGGIPKNVHLHVTKGKVYQTLPLYSSLGTTGTYVYATDFDIPGHSAVIHAESEVANDSDRPVTVGYTVTVTAPEGRQVASFTGTPVTIAPGQRGVVKAQERVDSLNFWSWGYGYLYDVTTDLTVNGKSIDDAVVTRTGFRQTKFGDGKIWLNGRVIQVKGYAQRTSNEWPGLGMSVPPWLSDYSNALIVAGNGNTVRWMHVTPWKQDVESCDRVGLMQAMPAGDAEKDREGRQWEQRTELMRDAIIYNRNNPSVIFYESGNESISEEHMAEMIAIRDKYDPHGGRAIGSREMLDIDIAEYGGEMLYINKSKKHPMWAMEYCRDEGLRKYWDEYSYPYHKEGDGPLYRNAPALDYNHNQDNFTVELVRRWYDYWRERPGTGTRCSSGGVKIIFSDTNTHFRGAENYRRSGVTDAMRIPKDGYYAHHVMWDGWVDNEHPLSYIVGHWNYPGGTVKPVYVVSNGEEVELLLNGRSLGRGKRDYNFLFTFPDVKFEPGELKAITYDGAGRAVDSTRVATAGDAARLKVRVMTGPNGLVADGADVAMVEFQVVDADGRRCPLDNRLVSFFMEGPAEWRGGIAQGENNYAQATTLPVECGINRALIRTLPQAGEIRLMAKADGLPAVMVEMESRGIEVKDGLSLYVPGDNQPCMSLKGPTPSTPSYRETKRGIEIASVTAGSNQEKAAASYDDNELSEWASDGHIRNGWITYKLERKAPVNEVCLKLTGWRTKSYPLEVVSGNRVLWSGDTDKSLGYIHLPIGDVDTDEITLRLKGSTTEADAFGQITELDPTQELDLFKAPDDQKTDSRLRIVEIEFLEKVK